MSEPIRLTLQLPSRQAPGFLRRQQQIARIQHALQGGDLSAFGDLVDFLLPFVAEPADRAAARDALLDASQEQLEGALHALGNPRSQPEPSAAPSDAG